jgi:hypothetical protein
MKNKKQFSIQKMSSTALKNPSLGTHRTARLQRLGSRRGVCPADINTSSVRGKTGPAHHYNMNGPSESELTTQEEWPFECLLAQRNIKGENEYLVKWAPTWEKASSISNLRDALRTLNGTAAKERAKSSFVSPTGHKALGINLTATKAVADAVAKWGKKVLVLYPHEFRLFCSQNAEDYSKTDIQC